jgi:hypothetical protein
MKSLRHPRSSRCKCYGKEEQNLQSCDFDFGNLHLNRLSLPWKRVAMRRVRAYALRQHWTILRFGKEMGAEGFDPTGV